MGHRAYSLLAAAGLLGCAGNPDTADSPRQAETPPLAATPTRGPIIGGEKVPRPIAWPSVAGDADAGSALEPEDHPNLSRAPAPVLLPPADHPLAGGRLMVGETWWAHNVSRDGLTLVIQASAQARLHDGISAITPTDRVRNVPGWVTQNEGIWSLSWIEYGAAYTLELECYDQTSPECRDDAYVRALAGSLVYAGGMGAAR